METAEGPTIALESLTFTVKQRTNELGLFFIEKIDLINQNLQRSNNSTKKDSRDDFNTK